MLRFIGWSRWACFSVIVVQLLLLAAFVYHRTELAGSRLIKIPGLKGNLSQNATTKRAVPARLEASQLSADQRQALHPANMSALRQRAISRIWRKVDRNSNNSSTEPRVVATPVSQPAQPLAFPDFTASKGEKHLQERIERHGRRGYGVFDMLHDGWRDLRRYAASPGTIRFLNQSFEFGVDDGSNAGASQANIRLAIVIPTMVRKLSQIKSNKRTSAANSYFVLNAHVLKEGTVFGLSVTKHLKEMSITQMKGASKAKLKSVCDELRECKGFAYPSGYLFHTVNTLFFTPVKGSADAFLSSKYPISSFPTPVKNDRDMFVYAGLEVSSLCLLSPEKQQLELAHHKCAESSECFGYTHSGELLRCLNPFNSNFGQQFSTKGTHSVVVYTKSKIYEVLDYLQYSLLTYLYETNYCKVHTDTRLFAFNNMQRQDIEAYTSYYLLREAYKHYDCIRFVDKFERFVEVHEPPAGLGRPASLHKIAALPVIRQPGFPLYGTAAQHISPAVQKRYNASITSMRTRSVTYKERNNRMNGRNARAAVEQALDIISNLRHVSQLHPNSHIMLWEDDCLFCDGTISTILSTIDMFASLQLRWGMLKVGNGGSGIVIHSDITFELYDYLIARRGSEGIDVMLWRYADMTYNLHYINRYSLSAHIGVLTSLPKAGKWKPVQCSNRLDWYWGEYKECTDLIQEGSVSANAIINPNPSVELRGMNGDEFDKQWLCSSYNP